MSKVRKSKVKPERKRKVRANAGDIDELEGWMVGQPTEDGGAKDSK